ncbi:MAG TPA: SPOR domain-containing protein [Patescibacteria group bacterium]|nr:SPOR domain-containing protein [Patescibacteria group bacterium]
MTPPDDDRPDGPEHDLYEERTPRSIFAATWFRALLVLIVLAVVGAVAVPYILDAMNPPAKSVASRPTTPTPTAPPPAVTPTPPSTTSPPTSPSSSAMSATADTAPDKTALPDKGPGDKPATAMPAPRRPLGADKTPTDKPAMSEKPATSDKSVASAKPAPTEKSATAEKKDTRMAAAAPEAKPRPEAKAAPTTTKRAATSSASTARAPRGAASGEWWVQVGAFRDESTAKKVVAKLREQNYKVEESVRGGSASATKSAAADKSAPAASAPSPAGTDQYDVFVSGLSAAELSERLAAKGLAAEPAGSGAVIKPSLPLRDAVALSKDLAVDGFKVQVRRAGGAAPAPSPRATPARPAEPAASGGDTLYRVRVGAFPDRATAMTTLKELEAKGYKPFIARGGP